MESTSEPAGTPAAGNESAGAPGPNPLPVPAGGDDALRDLVEEFDGLRAELTGLRASLSTELAAELRAELKAEVRAEVAAALRAAAKTSGEAAAGKRLTGAEERLTALETKYEHLNRRFTDVLSQRFNEAQAVPSTTVIGHQALAERYRSFLEQQVASYVAGVVKLYGRREREEMRAVYTRDVCRLVLGGPGTGSLTELWRLHPLSDHHRSPDPAVDRQIRDLSAAAAKLATAIAAEPGTHRWDFECRPGAALEPARQAPWREGPTDRPVREVVTPAYVVDERVLVPQQVLTD